MISRRCLLTKVAAVAMTCSLTAVPELSWAAGPAAPPDPDRANSRLDQLVPLIEPVLDLYNPNTKERKLVRFFGSTGYNRGGVQELNYLMRDWRQKEVTQIDIRLFWGLAAIRTAAMQDGLDGSIQINSGYRTARTNEYLRSEGYRTAVNSLHTKGRAIDFVVKGGEVADVAKYAQWLEIGGTGHYRGRFVHIDSGDVRVWFG